jgi:hypothetical protein
VWHVWGRGEVHTGFWWGDPRGKGHVQDLDVDGKIILKWIFKRWNEETWTGLLRLRIGTGCGLL